MVAIIVTGTPGTGKTELAKALSKQLRYKYIDVNNVVKKNKLIESYDKDKETNVIDEKKLAKVLVKLIKSNKNVIIDSHLSHYIPSRHVDLCIITKCELKELKKRLKKKGYKSKKIRENLDVEIFDVCLTEADEMKHKIVILDTTKKSAEKIAKVIIA